MATVTRSAMLMVQSLVGGTPTPYSFPEAASQTFVKGEVGFIDAGLAKEIAGDTPSQIAGVFNQPAHNDSVDATHMVSILLAHPSTVFEANLVEVALAAHVLVQADIGKYVNLIRDTTNSKVYLSATPPNGGANVRAVIIGIDSRTSAIGDTDARVRFLFLPNWTQFAATS